MPDAGEAAARAWLEVLANPDSLHSLPNRKTRAKYAQALLAALDVLAERAERLDGEGPQISMGTAAGILGREVDARKAAEARVVELERTVLEWQESSRVRYERAEAEHARVVELTEALQAALERLPGDFVLDYPDEVAKWRALAGGITVPGEGLGMCVQKGCEKTATRAVETNYGNLGALCDEHYAELEQVLASPAVPRGEGEQR